MVPARSGQAKLQHLCPVHHPELSCSRPKARSSGPHQAEGSTCWLHAAQSCFKALCILEIIPIAWLPLTLWRHARRGCRTGRAPRRSTGFCDPRTAWTASKGSGSRVWTWRHPPAARQHCHEDQEKCLKREGMASVTVQEDAGQHLRPVAAVLQHTSNMTRVGTAAASEWLVRGSGER